MDNEQENYTDIEIPCKDCGQPFIWTAGEQRFFTKKQLSQPVRCKSCREVKRSQRQFRESSGREERRDRWGPRD